jgi:hypothetical protein
MRQVRDWDRLSQILPKFARNRHCHDKHAATHREIALLTYRNGDTRRTCGKLGIGTDYLRYSPSSPEIVMDGFSPPNFNPCVRVWGYFVWKYFQL